MKPKAQIRYFRSRIDGLLQPCAVCATDPDESPKPLVLEVSPGATNLQASLQTVQDIADIAARNGRSCVALRPTGRGPGSVYQNYGEVDLFEAVEHVASVYPIDRRRVTVTGGSMGGAATWYLASHYPDVFAGAAPFCGYCDYRLWQKPGGLTFHMHPWQEPSWQSRSAALLVENLAHTPVWMHHGEWDRSVGGGVPVEHSRQMLRLMNELGFACRYTEMPKTGHGCLNAENREATLLWLLDQEKTNDPDHVALATFGLRHNRSYWLRIDQLLEYGPRGIIDATRGDQEVLIRTANVRALAVGPAAGSGRGVRIDGRDAGVTRSNGWTLFRRKDDGTWTADPHPATDGKRHGVSGPLGDLFFGALTLVPGTLGSDEETHFNNLLAGHAPGFFSSRNGGVHRGGIQGENSIELPVVADADLSGEQLRENNLLLYGSAASNAVLARFGDTIPISFEGGRLRVAGKTYTEDGAAVFAVFPHPQNDQRYVAVHGGLTPDAITWGSHLDMMLLPDYMVYARGEILDWGFWNNEWREAK